MLPWARKKKPAVPDRGPESNGAVGGEWDFLRDQPDHDADLMAGVHSEAAPAAEAPAPAVARRPSPPAAPAAPAAPARPAPRAPAPAPARRPGASYARPSGSATRPLTLLNDLCARFQHDQQAGAPWDGRYEYAPPAWVVTLEIETPQGVARRAVHQETILGRRDPESGWAPDIALPDDSVSRRHARIYRRSGRFWLQDLDSKNGTRHNGEWLAPGGETTLLEGDEIALGETCRLRVVDPTFQRDENGLRSFALWALTETLAAENGSSQPFSGVPVPAAGDLLDLALERGAESGLLMNGGTRESVESDE